VQVPGANLYIGDLHACMGQGEGALVAIESSGAATVRIDLVKNMGMLTGCVGKSRCVPANEACLTQPITSQFCSKL
jgi:acetamidase/formamidase